ncbi:SHOCT domain-containing protein [Ruminococcus sp.]|uniref:SHOCT domain-containing protein n=1 Tax=Ruminococcus sp. TaxID=41978 RepID=UPI0025DB6080|nr:SHOCT domain-containing protein [Ruminococcus sp.]
MTNERLQHIAAYKVAIILFRKLLKNGAITESEFHKCESNIAEKCNLSLCSIYREIA